jgi:hypothetical protein
MNDSSGLRQLLDQLDHWRNFAAYKLEQRIDPLIGMCLPDILEGRLKQSISENIIPEFPFPTERLLPEYDEKGVGSLRCDRIDYAAFCPDQKILYLIELKTDSTSVSEKQLDKLQQLAENSKCPKYVGKWVELIAKVAVASDKPRKYIPILNEILKWKLITCIEGVVSAAIESAVNNNRSSLNTALRNLKPDNFCDGVTIVPVLIAPKLCIENIKSVEKHLTDEEKRHNKIELITLGEAAAALSGNDDLQKNLKDKLMKWNAPATSNSPESSGELKVFEIPDDEYLQSLMPLLKPDKSSLG